MLNVIMLICRYAECHYTEYHYGECRYAECCYAECHYAEYHGAVLATFGDMTPIEMIMFVSQHLRQSRQV